MKKFPSIIPLSLILLVAFPVLAAKRDIRLIEGQGLVWIRSSESGDEEWDAVKDFSENIPLEDGEWIKTGPEPSEALIQFDADNTIVLKHNTQFQVVSSDIGWSKFKLKVGGFLSKVGEKLTERKRNVNIIMPTGVLAVRGTEFTAETADKEGDTGGVGVFEGHVEALLDHLTDAPAVVVGPDQEVDLTVEGPAPVPRQLKRFAAVKKRMEKLRERHAKLLARWRDIPEKRRRVIRQRIKMMQKRMGRLRR